MKIAEKSKHEGLRQKILRYIPIYGHYKLEEELREWYRSIRDNSLYHLSKTEDLINNMLEVEVSKRDRDSISKIEKSRRNIHIIKERIKTQTYGFFPSKSPIKIDKEILENILDVDEEIVLQSQKIFDKIQSIKNKYDTGSESEAIYDLTDSMVFISSIDSLLTRHFELLRTGISNSEGGE